MEDGHEPTIYRKKKKKPNNGQLYGVEQSFKFPTQEHKKQLLTIVLDRPQA
jgi:hypothetical protein